MEHYNDNGLLNLSNAPLNPRGEILTCVGHPSQNVIKSANRISIFYLREHFFSHGNNRHYLDCCNVKWNSMFGGDFKKDTSVPKNKAEIY